MVPQAAREHAVRQSRLTDDKSNSDATAPSAVPTTKYWAFLCADGFQRESQADERRDMLPSPATRRVHAHQQTPPRLSHTGRSHTYTATHTRHTDTRVPRRVCASVWRACMCGTWGLGRGRGGAGGRACCYIDQVIRENPSAARSVAGAPKNRQRNLSVHRGGWSWNAGPQQWNGGSEAL